MVGLTFFFMKRISYFGFVYTVLYSLHVLTAGSLEFRIGFAIARVWRWLIVSTMTLLVQYVHIVSQ